MSSVKQCNLLFTDRINEHPLAKDVNFPGPRFDSNVALLGIGQLARSGFFVAFGMSKIVSLYVSSLPLPVRAITLQLKV